MKKVSTHTQKGFSLIEILVSVAIFSVVVIAGTLSVLSIIDANQKSQSLNSVMTNLNIALETMAREIRIGSAYMISPDGTEISFKPDQGCDSADSPSPCLLTYRYQGTSQSIEKKDDRNINETEFIPITAEEVHITSMTFSMLRSTVPGYDTSQGAIVLKIRGYAETKTKTRSDFFLQTLMSQRLLQ